MKLKVKSESKVNEIDVNPVCEYCNGTGMVDTFIYDTDCHQYLLDGETKCPDCNEEDDYEPNEE
jgi:hypothetical protein